MSGRGSIAPSVTQVRVTAASDADIERGFLGCVRIVVDGPVVHDICLRRTLDGRRVQSIPARRNESEKQRFFARPITDEARRELERQIFERLHLVGEAAP